MSLHRWHWSIVPILAVLAYLPALGVGFLSDDFGFLFRAETRDLRGYLGWQILLPSQGTGVAFYRPFGMLTTWQFDWQLWGLNPFPYHLLGLLLHAATALVLGLLISDLMGKRSAGLLAGALFAVFPIHTEAVGWLSAQWDIWAALFSITSLWLFNRWWRTTNSSADSTVSKRMGWLLYALSLLAYTLAIFSKESALTWIGALCLVPLFSILQNTATIRRTAGKAIPALLPFGAVLLVYLTIRFVALGSFGGYAAASNSLEIFSKNAIGDALALLAPISPAVLGEPIKLLVGFLSGIVLVICLALYARSRPKMVAFCLVWLALSVVPVLNLQVYPDDLQGNRLLYLPAAGYCALIMILMQAALERLHPRARAIAGGLVGGALALFAIMSWAQVSIWQIATRQADAVGTTLARLIPVGDPTDSTPPHFVVRAGCS
jgi:hypothetical protein